MVSRKKLLIVVGVLGVSLAPRFLLTGVRTVFHERPVEFLPDEVAGWAAVEVLACRECLRELKEAVWQRRNPQNPDAQMTYLESEIEGDVCPVHQIPLRRTREIPMDFLAQKVLGPGTEFLRRWYRREAAGEEASAGDVMVTVVISGADKRSLHRPETCLTAQNWRISTRDRRLVPLAAGGKSRMEVTRLVARTGRGKKAERKKVVFYWYMGHNRLTGRNLKRLMYSSWDRMVHGLNYRWCYVLLMSPVHGSVTQTSEEMARFVGHLLPVLRSGS